MSSQNANVDTTTVEESTVTYARLKTEQRARLMALIDMSDPAAAMARMTELSSDAPVSDEDARTLGWVSVYVLGLSTSKTDVRVTRRKRGRLGSLDSFIASLDGGACNIDPDTVVYVRDEDGNEVETTVGQGDDKRRVPIVEARGAVASGLAVRLDDGEVRYCASGKRVTFEDCGGEDNYMRVVEFTRDGGNTWHPVRWTLTLPNSRTLGK